MMSPELEKRLEEVAQAFGPPEISPHALADTFRPLLRQVWREAIEKAAKVSPKQGDRDTFSAGVVATRAAILDLKEVD